jgi:hypothetical protein
MTTRGVAATLLATFFVTLGACKPKEVPFKPPPKDDAGGPASAAALPPDAPAARPVTTATKVVVGDHASCALMTDATLRCWGRNDHGQLGNGTLTDAATPVMPNLHGVKDVVMGSAHVCALLDDESVTCWGRINYGDKEDLLKPTAVPGLSRAKRMFAVGSASCATIYDASLVCWGDIDVKGHLRLAGGARETRVPTPSNGLDHVAALTANGALKEDGTVWFWGGDGQPARTEMTDVIEIASAGDEVCGLRRDGSVACAGPATRCAAAAPKPAPAKAPPTKKTRKKPAAKPRKKPAPKLARSATLQEATGKATGTTSGGTLPIEVLRLPPAKHLAFLPRQQPPAAESAARPRPASQGGTQDPLGKRPEGFDVGLCVVTRTGKLQCLQTADACKLDTPWPGLARVDYVTGNCARTANGSAYCWSVDSRSRVVREVPGVAGTLAIAASSSHACALLGDRSVACWGSNASGALGRGDADTTAHPEASPVTF